MKWGIHRLDLFFPAHMFSRIEIRGIWRPGHLELQPFLNNLCTVVGCCHQGTLKVYTASIGLPSSHVHPGAIFPQGKWCTYTQLPTWCKRKHDSSHEAIVFYCYIVKFWSHVHCRHFQWWTGVRIRTRHVIAIRSTQCSHIAINSFSYSRSFFCSLLPVRCLSLILWCRYHSLVLWSKLFRSSG